MPTRLHHRLRIYSDPDVLQASAVALLACVLSGGLVYLAYFIHVARLAMRASCHPDRAECVLVFGKHAPAGRMDAEFTARVARAARLWRDHAPRQIVLLGGAAPEQPSEAELARDGLFAQGLPADAPLLLEALSRDTLQNMRNARDLLLAGPVVGPLVLVSSRYHLARCALFARQLGFAAEPCAAEPKLAWTPRLLWQLAVEAAYVGVADIGTRWARITGNRRMLERVT